MEPMLLGRPLAALRFLVALLFAIVLGWGVAGAPTLAQPRESLTVVGGLENMVDEYLTNRAEQLWASRRSQLEALTTAAEISERQEFIRETILEALGGFPPETPLNPRITGVLEREGYRVEKLTYESLPGFYVTANVYVPTGFEPPFPAVLGTAGHALSGKAAPIYQRAWISLARRGFLVLAYDPMGQGERIEYYDPLLGRSRLGGGTREHTMAGLQCLLTGTHLARYELWDGIRAVDYLISRGDVDPRRIGVAGNSGGGTQSAYLAVVEPRLGAVVSSCYMTSWEELWTSPGPQDAEQNFPGFLLKGLDFSDFALAFAPRPFKILAAIRDYFPIQGARRAFEEARRVYQVLGSEEKVGFFEYDDSHGWSQPRREATYRWLERWLRHPTDEGAEPDDLLTEAEEELYCTPTGQLATSLGGETVQSLNQALAEEIFPRRTAAGLSTAEELRPVIARRIGLTAGLSEVRTPPRASLRGEVGRDGYRIEKVLLESQPGIQIPTLVFVPSGGVEKRPAVFYVHSSGKAADAAPQGDMEALVREGYLVMAVDPRGWGESGVPAGTGYSREYQLVQRAFLLGKTLVGMQVDDLLRSFDYLVSRADVDPQRVAVFGKSRGGLLALLAAALEPQIRKVAVEGTVLSYMAIVRARIHEDTTSIIIPGVLRDFDLPDVAAALAPRPVWIVDPRTATGARVPLAQARQEYRHAWQAYGGAENDGFRIVSRPEGWEFSRVYAEWLR